MRREASRNGARSGALAVDTGSSLLDARPGETVAYRFRVHNQGAQAAQLSVRVHGLGTTTTLQPLDGGPVAAGQAVDVEMPLLVPEDFGVGDHAVAIEVRSDRPADAPVLADVTVSVGSLDKVVVRIEPSIIRGRRRTRFAVEAINRRAQPTEVDLAGNGAALRVRIDPPRLRLEPGQTAIARGTVQGPRHLVGDVLQHVLTVEARGHSVPSYATASFQQKAVFPRRLRAGAIIFSILAVWALVASTVVLWWSHRDNGSKQPTSAQVDGRVDTNGDGVPDAAPGGDGSTNGQGRGGSGGGGGGGGGSGGGGGGKSNVAGAPTATIVRGTVAAGTSGANDGVLVTLTPTNPGAEPATTESAPASGLRLLPGGPGAAVHIGQMPASTNIRNALAAPLAVASSGSARSDGDPVKFWPDRYATYDGARFAAPSTLSVRVPSTVNSNPEGTWQFSDVPLRRSYEVTFAKPGFITKSFIVTPTDDGKPVELEVQLAPGDGALSGVITSAGGNVGGADISITDGTNVFATTSSTDAATRGQWSIDALSTPATYTITVTADGFGTEVVQITLGAAETRSGIGIRMSAGAGSILGTVRAAGAPLGGVTLSASTGADGPAATTTSLTQGAVGTYSFPKLPVGSTYTITASSPGYITQTRSVVVSGNITGVDFDLVSTTASIIGRVLSQDPNSSNPPVPLVNAAISVTADALHVQTSSAATPDAGAFVVRDLPPGTYVIDIGRYDHTSVSQLVTLAAGQVLDVGQVVLQYQARQQLQPTGSLVVHSVDSDGNDLNGATVQLIDVGGSMPTVTQSMPAGENDVELTAIPIGTYDVRVTKNDYRPTVISRLSIGLGPLDRTVTMLQFGTARGTVIDGLAGTRNAPLLDDKNNPVYVAAASTSPSFVYIDPSVTVPLNTIAPPLTCYQASVSGPCYLPQTAFRDAGGALVVRYTDAGSSDSLLLRDSDANNVPDQLLTTVNETIGLKQLSNYELLLYRVDGTALTCISPIVVSGSTTPDTEGRILWQIQPSQQLLSGTYRLRFSPVSGDSGSPCTGRGRLPDGYAAIADSAGNVGSFVIANDIDQKVVVPPISVAPYPAVSGRVLVPHFNGTAVTFADFAAAQASGLTVTIDCGGGRTANATVSAVGGGVNFAFTRAAIGTLFAGVPIGAGGALPACTLRTTFNPSTSFVPASTTLNLRVGFTAPYGDQVLTLAMVDDPGTIVGTTRWRDAGATGAEPTSYLIGNVSISANGVIVGYAPASTNDPDPAPPTTLAGNPTAITANLSAFANGSGAWAFGTLGQRQVLGTSDYVFTSSAFLPTTIQITADDNGWSAGATDPTLVVDSGSAADVYLVPRPGSLTGTVDLTSNRGTAAVGEIRVTATPPGGTASDLTVTPIVANIASLNVGSAAAGTWQLVYTSTAGSNVVPWQGAATQRPLVPPNGSVTASPVSMLELGQVEVDFTDTNGAAIADVPTVTLTRTAANTTFPAAFTTRTDVAADANGNVVLGRLPVDASAPLSAPTRYQLSFAADDYDTTGAVIEVSDTTGVIATFNGDAPFDVDVVAGSRLHVSIVIPRYGTIAGAVTGLLTRPGATPVNTEPLTIASGLGVVATRVGGSHDGDTYTAVVDPNDATRFVISAPAGNYSLAYAHADYIDGSKSVTFAVGGSANGDVQLELARGTIALSAIEGNKPIVPVAGVDVWLWPGVLNWPLDTNAALTNGATDAGGAVSLSNVYPGTYTVLLRKVDGTSGDDLHFPVIGTIVVPRGNSATARTVTRVAVMPRVDGSISGTVEAVNIDGDPVVLPAGATVTRSYGGPQLAPDGTTVNSVLPNRGVEGNISPTVQTVYNLVENTAGGGDVFTFGGLPRGSHHLTFSTAGGYSKPADVDVTVTGATPIATPFQYIAANVTVDVTLTTAGSGAAVSNATLVTLTTPSGVVLNGAQVGSTNVYRFAAVAPRIGNFTLTVKAPLRADYTDTTVTVTPSATTKAVAAPLTAVARVTGIVRTKDTAAASAQAVQNVSVGLFLGGVQQGASVQTDSSGRYDFPQVTATGNYEVRTSLAGYVPATGSANVTALGAQYNRDLQLDAYAGAVITLNGNHNAVTVSVSPNDGNVSVSGSTVTITNLDPGTDYTFTASGTGVATQSSTFSAVIGGSYTHTFVWRSVSGSVTNAYAGATVTLRTGSGFTTVVDSQVVTTASPGFEFEDLAPGSYRITVVRTADNVNAGNFNFSISAAGAYSPSDPPYDRTLTATTTTTTTPPTTTTTTPPTTTTTTPPATTTTSTAPPPATT